MPYNLFIDFYKKLKIIKLFFKWVKLSKKALIFAKKTGLLGVK